MDDGSQQQAAPASGGSSPPVVDDGQQQAVAAPGGPSPWAGTPLEDLPPLLPPTPGYPEGDQQGEGQPARDEPAQGQPTASPPPTAIFPAGSGNPQAHPSASHPTEGYPTEGDPTEGFPTEEYLGDDDAEDLGLVEASMGPPPRVRLLTVLLVLGIITALGFAGGVLVQRRHDSTLVSAPGAGGFANRAGRGGGVAGGAGGGGFGGGGFGGAGQGTGARAGAGAGGAGGGAGAGAAGGDAAAATPVVVGTVTAVTPTTLTVKNFAGAVVIVHVPAGTPVTTRGLAGLKTGVTVAVTGTKAADGSVTATSVVSRG